ncbi:MAG: tRNA lysidine(34) synthetase TilS [Planctomycetes bacterium]|nr:tRNA lysidine(34) synthetase TilS [Planctomycetota bacterium]
MHSLVSKLADAWPTSDWDDISLLLAVSGGADSVGLLSAMVELKGRGEGRIFVAHFNHALRGAESDADATFVCELCRRLDLPCEIGTADTAALAREEGDGLEAAARGARYAFLQTTAERLGARYVVTAHTADDQAETILHRIVRGTGLAGLAGIRRARSLGPAVTLIRPLLAVHREELVDYLDQIKQPFREDASNRDVSFTRNRIRHELLPALAAGYNPNVRDALLRLGSLAGEAQAVIDHLADELLERCMDTGAMGSLPALAESWHRRPASETTESWHRRPAGETQAGRLCHVTLHCGPLSDVPVHVVRTMFMSLWRRLGWPEQSMGRAEWDQLAALATAREASPQQVLPGAITAKKQGEQLMLTRVQPPLPQGRGDAAGRYSTGSPPSISTGL